MDADAAFRVIGLFEGRGQVDRIEQADSDAARACLGRAKERLTAATVLVEAKLLESVFTTAYDAFRTAADAVVLLLGYRVPATQGGHRIATDIANAAMKPDTDAFAPAGAERFRQGRTSRSTSTQRDRWTRPPPTRAGPSSSRSERSTPSRPRSQPTDGSPSCSGIGIICLLVTVSWNDPLPSASQSASRMVTCTGRPSRGPTRSTAA